MKRLNLSSAFSGAFAVAALSALALAAGCNKSTEGAEGELLFTPDNCDLIGLGCSFDLGLAAGGSTDVRIRPVSQNGSTAGLDLVSDDETILIVEPTANVGGQPTWELTGVNEGVTNLVAIDVDGTTVDFIEVDVVEISGLRLINLVGNAVGPNVSDPNYDEVWELTADIENSFYVEPLVGPDRVMGRMAYTVDASDLLNYLSVDSNPGGGFYDLLLPEGDYELFVTSDNGTQLNALLQAFVAN